MGREERGDGYIRAVTRGWLVHLCERIDCSILLY